MMSKLLCIAFLVSIVPFSESAFGQTPNPFDAASFACNELLGRPTDQSVTVSVVPRKDLTIYIEYGTTPLAYSFQSVSQNTTQGTPAEFTLRNLAPNTRYYYRVRYKEAGASTYAAGPQRTFHTQRAPGTTFTFTIEADPHPYDKKGSHTLWNICLANQLRDSADFIIDLGDTFGDDHNPFTITSNEVRQLHLDCRTNFGVACHSAPLVFCLGNHEGESGYYLLQTPPNNLGVYGTTWRKYYYPNPVPDDFYTGNTTSEDFGMGLPQDYYAWHWGDALFVVLDAYRGYTASAKPRGWDWTLGEKQYLWFKQTLETSTAKFKFVFIHHTLGETRGGAITAKLYEWGGYENDGRTWGFTTNRPGWAMPIHQLMVRNGVNIFFQGHDHLYAREVVDSIVYQEVPMPSDSTYIIGTRDNGDAYTDLKIDASGHVRVAVSPTQVKVDYVRAWLPADEPSGHKNGEVAYSYTVAPKTTSVEDDQTIPDKFGLEQNYPNPFNPSTAIRYWVSTPGLVSLVVYDLLGRTVAQLVQQEQSAGRYEVRFDGTDLPSGLYIYQLSTGAAMLTKKAMLLK